MCIQEAFQPACDPAAAIHGSNSLRWALKPVSSLRCIKGQLERPLDLCDAVQAFSARQLFMPAALCSQDCTVKLSSRASNQVFAARKAPAPSPGQQTKCTVAVHRLQMRCQAEV